MTGDVSILIFSPYRFRLLLVEFDDQDMDAVFGVGDEGLVRFGRKRAARLHSSRRAPDFFHRGKDREFDGAAPE